MTTIIGAADQLLCHCGVGISYGHEPGVDGCDVVVRTGRYGHDWCTRDHMYSCASCHGGATGTCPMCSRKRVKVARVETHGLPGSALARRKGETDLEFIVRRNKVKAELKKNPRGPLLRVSLALAAHRTPGRGGTPCPGAGQVPAETRFTPGRDLLADWIATYGPDSVVTR